VTARIALASAGGVDGSFFTDQRCLPRLSRHSHGDSNVTGTDVAAAVLERNAIAAMMSVVAASLRRFISFCHCRAESKRGTMPNREKNCSHRNYDIRLPLRERLGSDNNHCNATLDQDSSLPHLYRK